MRTSAKLFVIVCWTALSFAFLTTRRAASVEAVPYPEGYREWVHVKSEIIGPESPLHKRYGGIHHIYANPKAIEGFKTGNFPDGAVIVFDLLEAQTKAGVTSEGPRRFIDVMHKNSGKFAATGGWGFEEFNRNSTTERLLTEETAGQCFACHASQKERGYVFSSLRK